MRTPCLLLLVAAHLVPLAPLTAQCEIDPWVGSGADVAFFGSALAADGDVTIVGAILEYAPTDTEG